MMTTEFSEDENFWKKYEAEDANFTPGFQNNTNNNCIFQSESEVRRWLSKHGKKQYIDFTDGEIAKLHKYFEDLDEDGSGKKYFRKFGYSSY